MSTEHPAEAEGLAFQWRMFVAMAAFIGLIAVVYWFASYEHAGTTMLALSGGLALLCGGWLFVQDRRSRPRNSQDRRSRPRNSQDRRSRPRNSQDRRSRPRNSQDRRKQPAPAGEAGAHEEAEPYLPHASPWPFVIGLGAAICANALILGFAYGIPGAVIVIFGVTGFVSQGRRRA